VDRPYTYEKSLREMFERRLSASALRRRIEWGGRTKGSDMTRTIPPRGAPLEVLRTEAKHAASGGAGEGRETS
jgi:hypothetical protein